jgi:hypothetical protein
MDISRFYSLNFYNNATLQAIYAAYDTNLDIFLDITYFLWLILIFEQAKFASLSVREL